MGRQERCPEDFELGRWRMLHTRKIAAGHTISPTVKLRMIFRFGILPGVEIAFALLVGAYDCLSGGDSGVIL